MSDSAQDYTYEVLGVDSSGEATIQLTSYDSLQHTVWYQVSSDDSDGSIADVVKQNLDFAVLKWSEERETERTMDIDPPSITVGNPVYARYKTVREDAKPTFNLLTKALDQFDSETNDEIITHFSIRNLTDSEKAEVYSNLSLSRDHLWLNLLEAGLVDSASTILGIEDPAGDSAEIDFRHGHSIGFSSSASQEVQTALGINDSDFAKIFVRD